MPFDGQQVLRRVDAQVGADIHSTGVVYGVPDRF